MNDRERDQLVERLLRRSDASLAAPGPCLDPETLAGWADGGLNASQLAMVEAHVSACPRCLAMTAALGKSSPIAPTPAPRWRSWGLGWLVPLAAATAAVTVWIALPNGGPPPVQPAATESRADASRPAKPQALAPAASKPEGPALSDRVQTPPAVAESRPAADERARTSANATAKAESVTEQDRVASAAPAPAAPLVAAPASESPAAAPARTAGLFRKAGGEIGSPNPLIRWRIGDAGSVDYSANGGVTWEPRPTGVFAELTAGAAPSATVCWLVGRAGTVLLTTDGRSFQRLAFPEAVDLVTVHATDARTATVTAAEGRMFHTTDGGVTWTR